MARKLRNWQVNRVVDREIARCAASYASGRLVDIGCATKPYAEIFRPYVTEHVGVDHEGSMHSREAVDLTGTAYEVPAASDSFDTALCTAVLEHLEEPESALRECYRLIRPGGVAIYTAPFIWPVHEEPRDFFRYSRYGLEYLFRKSGFEIVEVKALSGFWLTFGQQLAHYLDRFNRGPLRWFRIVDVLGLGVQAVAALLDRIDRADRWTWMYLVVASKPRVGEPLATGGQPHSSPVEGA